MNDPMGLQDRFAEVEALVSAAGEYVRASEDLRPRTLEAARTERGEKRGKRWVRHAAIAAAILGVTVSIGNSTGGALPRLKGADAVYQEAEMKAACSGGFSWGLVQAFADMRERQSEMLRSD
jgi:hypothetical protein